MTVCLEPYLDALRIDETTTAVACSMCVTVCVDGGEGRVGYLTVMANFNLTDIITVAAVMLQQSYVDTHTEEEAVSSMTPDGKIKVMLVAD